MASSSQVPTTSSSIPSSTITQAPLQPIFILNARPSILDASIATISRIEDYVTVSVFEVACPTAENDANAQCSAAGLFPAQIYHSNGSVFGGTFTYPATTTWECVLGAYNGGADSGLCSQWRSAGGTTTTTSVDACYLPRHSVPVHITAGAEKVSYYQFSTWNADQYNSVIMSDLEKSGCPSPSSLVDLGITTSTSSISAAASGTSTTTTTEYSEGQLAASSATIAPSNSATSSGSKISISGKLICVLVASLIASAALP